MNDLSKKKVIVPNDLFFDEVHEVLKSQKRVSIYVQGDSMRPFLRNSDEVILSPVHFRKLKVGRIVLARTSIGVVLHRVISITGDTVILSGDAHSRQLEKATSKDVLAEVVAAYRYGKELQLDSPCKRFLIFIWKVMRPLRGVTLRSMDLYQNIKK